jgi:hypothetical protein
MRQMARWVHGLSKQESEMPVYVVIALERRRRAAFLPRAILASA